MTDSNQGDSATRSRSQDVRAALRNYERPLLQYAHRILGDADRARDVVQDTFLKLWVRPPESSSDHLAQWLFTVCRNRALDVRRKERRMKPWIDNPDSGSAGHSPGPAEQAAAAEAAGHVTVAVADLPTNQQEVLRLKFQHGFSYRQIASITGLSVSNVGYLIHVGIKALRSKFQTLGLMEGEGASS